MGTVPYVVEDCQGIVKVFSDGSILRHQNIDFTAFPVIDDGSVVSKDYCFDKLHNLHLRLYKPAAAGAGKLDAGKLAVVYYLHGGGFCLGSFTWPNVHNCCLRLSSALNAVVVAPDYRLAPEHRLPAAVDDSLGALRWVAEGGADTWLCDDGVDFDRFFIIGDSSGGNIAHQLAVRLGAGSPELSPVRVKGYILMAPFFGGTERTKSEAEGTPEPFLNIHILDMYWRLSLPSGKTADHPFANPFGPNSPSLDPFKLDPILIIVGGDELLKDRVHLYAKRLQDLGKNVDYVEFEGKQHGFFTNDPYSDVSDSVLQLIKNFISKNSDD